MENQGRKSEEANQALSVQLQPLASHHAVGALRSSTATTPISDLCQHGSLNSQVAGHQG